MLHVALFAGWLTAPLALLFPTRSLGWNDVEGDVVLPTEVELLAPDALSTVGTSREASALGEGLDGGTADASGPGDALDGGGDGGERTDAGRPDGGREPSPPKTAEKPVEKGTSDKAPKDVSRLRDPLVFSGKAGALAGKDPNVSIMVLPESFRKHAAAARLRSLLVKLPQWRAFLDATGLDPITDVDRLLVAGPQLKESGKVAVVIKHRWPAAKMREALERLREKAGGAWEDGAPPTLRTTLDGGERFVVVLPGGVLVVVPLEALAQARAMKGGGFPSAHGEALLFTLKSPAAALRGLPFVVPTSIESVRIAVVMRADGGADLTFDGATSSATAAAIAADVLGRGVEAATTRKTFLGTIRLFDAVVFSAEGTHVRAKMPLHAGQLAKAIEIVGEPIEVAGSAP